MNTPTNITPEWEERFIDKFAVMLERYTAHYDDATAQEMIEEVLHFIEHDITQARQEAKAEVLKEIYQLAIDDIEKHGDPSERGLYPDDIAEYASSQGITLEDKQ
jgi:hypothetical protein